MSELHKFLFDGLPVRGMIVRLTDAWTEILQAAPRRRRHRPWPWPVAEMLGEMAAAGVLMQSNIKFNGALIMQIFGEGPVKVAVAEVQQDLSLRVTAKVVGEVAADAHLQDLVNVNGRGRCAITLDPKERLPGQQAYQGVVPLNASHGAGAAEAGRRAGALHAAVGAAGHQAGAGGRRERRRRPADPAAAGRRRGQPGKGRRWTSKSRWSTSTASPRWPAA
jgi:hypothetical protein